METTAPGAGTLTFPTGFLWGASTAAHQVEGGNANNDWWAWEHLPGRTKRGEVSGDACDHFHRYRADFDLLHALGHTAHRFSLEWSRIEPRPSQLDPTAIEHYREVLLALRERGMEPFVTLHHFTNPRWFAAAGGWLRGDAPAIFARFSARMAAEYRHLVRYWITINEPTVFAYHGFVLGERPPGLHSPVAGLRVLRQMLRAHRLAYRAIKAIAPEAQVGVAHQRTVLDPHRPHHLGDQAVARLRLWLMDEAYTTLYARHEDFAGVNYYARGITRFSVRAAARLFGDEVPAAAPALLNSMGWEIYPDGLRRVLLRARRGRRPIFITENGVPDHHDELRPRFLVEHLRAVHQAIQAGAPVAGYLHWTSMDNFEWTDGFAPRFGLIAVDRATQTRHPKPSAYLFRDVIQANAIAGRILDQYGTRR